jgi:hypothetical protein
MYEAYLLIVHGKGCVRHHLLFIIPGTAVGYTFGRQVVARCFTTAWRAGPVETEQKSRGCPAGAGLV